MWTAVVLLVAFIHFSFAVVYFYLTWFHKYWENRGVLSVKPLTIFGTYPGILFNKRRSFILDIQDVYE